MTDVVPTGWSRATFGDVVRQVKASTKEPQTIGLDRVVGLEHLDPGSLEIERWDDLNELADGTSFTRVFRSGQVLFGKRRAYQRKVALASFDGICSGDILVFEPSGDELLPEYLPYVVQSDGFFDHALGTSAGSLSPRTKFQDLAKYPFPLPPRKMQSKIVELLVGATGACAATERAARSAEATLDALAAASLSDPSSAAGMPGGSAAPHVPLRQVADLRRGRFSHRPRNEPRLYASEGPYPFVQTGDIQRAERHLSDYTQYLSEEGTRFSRCVPGGTLLTTIAAVIGATAYTTEPTYLPDSVVSVDPTEGGHVGFLELLLRGLRPKLEHQVATENTQKNLSLELLGAVSVPQPSLEVQERIADRAEAIWCVHASARQAGRDASTLYARLREHSLMGAVGVQ